jgi:OmpA-OmpF porin, OOP family
MIDPALGSVGLTGSQQVCPPDTTQYAIAATGAGGTARASTTVTVTAPPPPPPPPAPAPKVIDRLTLHINFDTDKSVIRNADVPELQKALAFVQKYAGSKVSIEGHTDNVGSEKYNQGLSERRAAAVKSWLLAHGATDGAKMQTVGYGESRPIADNKTPQGRFENRRVEILIVSE